MDLSGSVLAGRYRVYGELCRGYYGITWGAFDLSLSKPGNTVCIKVSNIDIRDCGSLCIAFYVSMVVSYWT